MDNLRNWGLFWIIKSKFSKICFLNDMNSFGKIKIELNFSKGVETF